MAKVKSAFGIASQYPRSKNLRHNLSVRLRCSAQKSSELWRSTNRNSPRYGPTAGGHVFHRTDGSPWPNSHLGQQHSRVRALLKMPSDFVLHSLRHTFGTRLGEPGADAFTIMRLMGHSTVTVSQRYVHPSPEALELAYERLTAMNSRQLPTYPPTVSRGDVAVVS